MPVWQFKNKCFTFETHIFQSWETSFYVLTSSLSISCSDLHFLLFCFLDQLIVIMVDLSISPGTSINFGLYNLMLFH